MASGISSSFQDEYINLLEDALHSPTIRLPPVAHPWRLKSSSSSSSSSASTGSTTKVTATLRSLLTRLVNIDWLDLYRIPKSSQATDPTQKKTFKTAFTQAFNSDPRVDDHIEHILNMEVESGVLDEHYRENRQAQLRQWLHDYYFNQLNSISNTSTSTRNNHIMYLKMAYVVFAHILPHIFKDGIWVHKRYFLNFLNRLSELDPSNDTICLLPNHKSHIDYIIIHFMYVRFELETPLVIAGDNLNVPVFGPYLKKLGAIFIKRKFGGKGNQDFWYTGNMRHLINWKLFKNQDVDARYQGPLQVELFIEGTRSRNGKLMLPKTGFMQLLKDSLQSLSEETNSALHVQPISLIYEKPYEFKEYMVELNGMDKVQESFTSILSAGTKVLLGDQKSDNYGKLIIKFNDGFLNFNDYPDVKELSEEVLRKIHDVSYITEISVLGLAMSIIFYKQVHVKRLQKLEVIQLFRELCEKLVVRSTDNDHLMEFLTMTDELLITMCDGLLKKFLKGYITIINNEDVHEYMIMEETALVYYKNSLLNNFITEMFLIKTKGSPMTMTVLKKLFEFEFLTSRILDDQPLLGISTRDEQLFGNLLNPFIESYELVLNNLKGVLKISLKHWLHLLYLSSPNVSYKESLNKSNILYAIYTFQSLKLIKLNKNIEIEVLDEDTMGLFSEYLHSLRISDRTHPLKHSSEVFQRVSNSLLQARL